MNANEIQSLINRSLFADLGYIGADGMPAVRRVFCTWHRGVGGHLISTNTSSGHVSALQKDNRACLYFADGETFEGVCLTGRAVPHFDPERRRLLWHEGDEKYYPKGVEDPDYCVIEFTAERAEYYRYDGKGTLSGGEISAIDAGKVFEDGFNKEQKL